jgi:hypothetical protein
VNTSACKVTTHDFKPDTEIYRCLRLSSPRGTLLIRRDFFGQVR